MIALIKNIAIIQTGLFAKPSDRGEIVYLQAKHFDEHGQISKNLFPDVMSSSVSDKHLLKPGDIVFAAKGTKNFATIYQDYNPPAVASTSFFVIRLTDNSVLPEYLAWFLNASTTQRLLKEQAIGTSMPSISKQVLENLELVVPSLQIQKAILQITRLQNREKVIKQKIELLRETQIHQQIINAIK